MYDLLMKTAAQTLQTVVDAEDPVIGDRDPVNVATDVANQVFG